MDLGPDTQPLYIQRTTTTTTTMTRFRGVGNNAIGAVGRNPGQTNNGQHILGSQQSQLQQQQAQLLRRKQLHVRFFRLFREDLTQLILNLTRNF